MAVIVMDMNMPTNCSCCEFSKRLDNSRTYCTRKPFEKPVNDGEDRPEYCPLKEHGETGYWNGSECSNCHAIFVRSVFDKPEYCSHCGAKMERR